MLYFVLFNYKAPRVKEKFLNETSLKIFFEWIDGKVYSLYITYVLFDIFVFNVFSCFVVIVYVYLYFFSVSISNLPSLPFFWHKKGEWFP